MNNTIWKIVDKTSRLGKKKALGVELGGVAEQPKNLLVAFSNPYSLHLALVILL